MTSLPAKPNVRDSLAALTTLIDRGQSERAEPLARRLQQAYPRRADVNHMLGRVLLAMGRPELAEPFHRLAVEGERQNTDYLLNLGLCLFAMGRVAEAAPYYERAAAIEPHNPVVMWRTASFRFGLGQGGDALELFRRALAKAPPAVRPDIHLELIECLLTMGLAEEAEAELRQCLDTTPHRVRYITLLSGIGKPGPDSEAYRLVEEALKHLKRAPMARSDLMTRKGVMLENGGRYDEALETILAAKSLLGPPPPAELFDREVTARMAAFSREGVARLAERYGDAVREPIFVVGLPRSGTTLAAQIISTHPEVGSAGELETLTYVAARMRGSRSLSELEANLDSLGADGVRALADLYYRNIRYLVPGKARAVDKMPDNFRYCGEIAILFPRARIVHCRRHPADTFISAFQSEMNEAHGYSYTPESYAAHYASYARLMRHWSSILPGQIFDLDYERLTVAPREVVSELLAFLGLAWNEACLHPERNTGTVRTFSRLQVRSAINSASVGRWKNYAGKLVAITHACDLP